MKRKAAKRGKSSQEVNLQKQYQTLFQGMDTSKIIPTNRTLEQPNAYQDIRTFTTYGAYQDPI
jgi:hypothetical protein